LNLEGSAVEETTFDRVVVVSGPGARRSYSAEEFLALPLAARIQHILTRDVEFFRGHIKIERAEALKSLRR
jgi:hypothetical protein